jgi:hypothetical protein
MDSFIDRYTLIQVREHDWCRKNHPCDRPPVTITPNPGEDPTLSTSVLPYLVELHMTSDQDDDQAEPYITEHDLREHERHLQAEAAAIVAGEPKSSRGVSRRQNSSSKTTKCIKVKKITGCALS